MLGFLCDREKGISSLHYHARCTPHLACMIFCCPFFAVRAMLLHVFLKYGNGLLCCQLHQIATCSARQGTQSLYLLLAIEKVAHSTAVTWHPALAAAAQISAELSFTH